MAKIDLALWSAEELARLTNFPPELIIEWLNFARNITLVSNEGDTNQAQVAENTNDIGLNATAIGNNATNLSTHEGLSTAHGSTGNIVGNGDTAQLATAGVVLLAVAVTDAVDSTVSVDAADATDLPTVITLANETKADVTTLVTDLNNAITQLNDLMARLRSSGALNT